MGNESTKDDKDKENLPDYSDLPGLRGHHSDVISDSDFNEMMLMSTILHA